MSAATITINVLSSMSTGATSGYFVLPGDFTEIFYPGYQFTFTGVGLLNLLYTVVPPPTGYSSLVNGNTQVYVNQAVVGTIVNTSAFVVGNGTYIVGTYQNVALNGQGSGSGAVATVVVTSPAGSTTTGQIYQLNSLLSGGVGYTPGTYYNVPLVGGTGTGAKATIVVYPSGVVGTVGITTAGTGYSTGDVLAATIPGGSGFAATVMSVLGTLTSVSITNPGVAYTVGSVLTFGGIGFGLNNSLTVTQVTTSEIGTITLNATIPMFKYGQNIFCIVETLGNWGQSAGQGPYIGEWSWFGTDGWDWLNPIGPFIISPRMQVPAVQGGQILQVQVTTNDSSQTPLVTYQIRLTGQTGVTTLHESLVFVDKPTALAAYSAMVM